MPNADNVIEAQIFPVITIQLQSSSCWCMNHALRGSPTSARLLPASLTYLNCYSPLTIISQHIFWHRHPVCSCHACSEFETRTQTKSKQQHLAGMHSNVENVQWQNAGQWQDDLDFSTELCAHPLADTRGSICPPPCDLVWLTSRTLHLSDISPRLSQRSQLTLVPSQEPASTLSQNSSTGPWWDLQCIWAG